MNPARIGLAVLFLFFFHTNAFAQDEPEECLVFVRGDADGDGVAGLSDALVTLQWAFLQEDRPVCLNAMDVDRDGEVNPLFDSYYLLRFLLANGNPPVSERYPDYECDTPEGVLAVATREQLDDMRNETDFDDFLLCQTLDLDGFQIEPIEMLPTVPGGEPRTFSFDGNGYQLENLTIDGEDQDLVGLFTIISEDSVVSNLTLSNPDISAGDDEVGAVAGSTRGRIENCVIEGGTISGDVAVGAVTGVVSSTGVVTGIEVREGTSIDGDRWIGGIAGGVTGGTISESSVDNASITGRGAGGIAGFVNAGGLLSEVTVLEMTSVEVRSAASQFSPAGGITASGSGSSTLISRASFHGSLAGSSAANLTGGIVGRYNDGTIEESFAETDIEAGTSVGGIVGYVRDVTISNTYFRGSITAEDDVGGLVGSGLSTIIEFSYAAFEADCASCLALGGVAGNLEELGATLTSTFYDSTLLDDTSIPSDAIDGIGLPTEELQIIGAYDDTSPFIDEPWSIDTSDIEDSTTTWVISSDADEYPELRWSRPTNDD